MKATTDRARRLGELLQRELSQLLQRELNDKSLGMVTVTRVVATPDLRHAKIYVTFLNEQEAITECVALLNDRVPFLRSLLAGGLNLRMTPNLKFYHDESLSRANRMLDLLDEQSG